MVEPPAPEHLPPRVRAAGEAALVIEYGDTIDPARVAQVQALDRAIEAARLDGCLPGIIETVPTFRSVAILLDPLVTTPAEVADAVLRLVPCAEDPVTRSGREWCLPVHYGGEHGPDLASLASTAGLDEAEAIRRHCDGVVDVFMLGFLPGFAFMGTTDPSLQQPRRSEPRVHVPAGSVALAMQLTAVYPWESPGGWHLIGHCPVALFDASARSPTLLAPGDRVRFRAIDIDEHAHLCAERAAGTLHGERFLS